MAMDFMALQPHKVSRDPSGYITYIFGKGKIGKTSLAAQAKDCILLATERGYNAIDGIIVQDITDWKDMRDALKQLKLPSVRERFKVVIVDTIDLAAKYCTKHICVQHGVSDLGEVGYGKAYAQMRSEFEDVFMTIAQLGYAVIFIGHEKYQRDEATGAVSVKPSLSPDKVNDIICNMADIYGWAHYANYEEETGARVLTVRSNHDDIACGTRFKYMKSEFPFNYDSLVQAIGDAIDEAEKNGDLDNFTDEPIQFIDKEYDFDELTGTFNDLVGKIQEASGMQFGSVWAPRIVEITETHLGKGKKVKDMIPQQAELLAMIVDDLEEAVANGI